MKQKIYTIIRALFAYSMFIACVVKGSGDPMPNSQAILTLLSMPVENKQMFRAPSSPTGLASSLGSVNFQAYNGGATTPYTQGANITAYYGQTGAPVAGQTLPANTIISTVPAVNSVPVPRVFIGANGRIAIGNFGPTDSASVTAALQVEGDNATGAASPSAANAMHVGPRTTPLASFVTARASSIQPDGNLSVAQTTQTAQFTGYGLFDPINYIPMHSITTPVIINEFPFTINNPGKYALYQPTSYAAAAGIPAISIRASDVVLDLQGFSLEQSGGAANVTAININASVSNVTIRNGTINNFTRMGVEAQQLSTTKNNIQIQNMNFTSCQQSAIIFSDTNNIVIKNINVFNCATNASNVFSFGTCNGIKMDNVLMSRCGLSGGSSSFGISIQSSNNVFMRNVAVNNFINGADVSGFATSISQNIIFKNCSISGNVGSPGMRGFRDQVSGSTPSFSQYFDCAFNNNTAAASAGYVGWENILASNLFNCMANGNTIAAFTGSTNGFIIANQTVALNCIASNDTPGSNNNTAIAFTNALNTNIGAFINCFTGNNNVRGGSGIVVTSNGILVRNCRAWGMANGFTTSAGGLSALENLQTGCTGAYSGFPAGSFQARTMTGLSGFATSNPWFNSSVN